MLKKLLYQIGLGMCLRDIFVINDRFRSTQATVGGTTPLEAVQGCVRKQAQQSYKQHSSRASASAPALPSLSDGLLAGTVSGNLHSPPHVLSHSKRKRN